MVLFFLPFLGSYANFSAMIKLRLQRIGRKHEPVFRLVATDSQNSTKSGKFKELLGSFDPRQGRGGLVNLKVERIKHWLAHGAQATPTVHNLLIDKKVITGKKINVLGPKPIKEMTPRSDLKEAPRSDLGGESVDAKVAPAIELTEAEAGK